MKFISRISKRDQHTYGLLLRVIGTLLLIYITAQVGGFIVILGELITWINFDDEEPCSYHGKPPLIVKELKKKWNK